MAEQGSSKPAEAVVAPAPAPIVVKAHGHTDSPEGSPRTSEQQELPKVPPSSYFKLYRWAVACSRWLVVDSSLGYLQVPVFSVFVV
jgi:hypothetical protein